MKKFYTFSLFYFIFSFLLFHTSFGQVVINEVYGGGGNAGATYKNDFIELYNNGSTPVNLAGWSVQYNSAAGTAAWQKTDLTGVIPANGYYLIQEAAGTGGTTELPTPNAIGAINMSGTAGKVTLVNSTTQLVGQNPVSATIMDKVAFGSVTGGGFEGTGAAPAPSNTASIHRMPEGTDTDNNSLDFKTGAPTPTSAGVVPATTVSVTAGNSAAEPASVGSFIINFSTPTTASTDVNYAFGGTAFFGTDFTASYLSTPISSASGTLTVPEGTSSVTVNVTPVDDNSVEGIETVSLTLSNPTQGYTNTSAALVINLADNDAAPTVSVSAVSAAAEPATNGTFKIDLSSPAPAGGVVINYTLAGTATLNTDYTDAQSGTVTIAEGSMSATVTLTTTDDAIAEGVETIAINITGASAGYTITNANASVNLSDNEISPITLTGTYSQNFNSLAIVGTTNTVNINGWSISETGGGARDNELFAADNGSSTTGDTYSYGTTSSTDRALGSLQSGSLVSAFGAFFTNNSGKTITSLKIDYTGEQWRLGSASRQDRLDFQYSSNASDLTNGTWNDVNEFDFSSPNITTTGAKDGNDAANRTSVSYTINNLSIPVGATFFIRWNDFNGSGADDGLAIDDFSIEANPKDLTAPIVESLSPASFASNVSTNLTASVDFNETVIKGTGSIVVRQTSNNSVVKTIDVSSSDVILTTDLVSFNLSGLAANTGYSVEVPAGTFTDLSGNPSASTTWSFTTGNLFYAADFSRCSGTLTDGFTEFSKTGESTWVCTPFGRDSLNPAGTAAAPNGVQMNGFAGGTNVPNVDWLISPSFNLTATTYPLLSFYSRTAFNGLPLQLKVSTDYVSGDPANATWTDINGKFPNLASNVWTLSSGINLAAFKGSNVHFAFVYTSSADDGARWTINDIAIDNSATPPPPSLTVSATDVRFAYVAGGTSADKTITFTGNDLTDDVTIQSTGSFMVSKDGSTFGSSVTYTATEVNNISTPVYVRFAPAEKGQEYTGTVTVSTSSLTSAVTLKGTSIDPATTLEVVNWNIEWFGSTEFGPTNEDQQEQNIKKILANTGADVFALSEVVDEARLARVVSAMPGYSYTISNFSSHTNTTANSESALADAQKLAFVYKTSVLSNVTAEPLLSAGINTAADLSNPAYSWWSSGRYPYMMTADVTLNCVTKKVRFILVHAKANTSPTATAYARRESGADTLHQVLQTLYPNDNIVILGDFNDDFDQSITAGFTTTSWSSFKNDNANFEVLTLPLSEAGKKSTVSYNDMIDHVVVSTEMEQYYMPSTATVLSDVTSLVSNYGSTTTDHYPVFTRYRFENPTTKPIVTVCPVVPAYCATTASTYNVPAFAATAYCGDIKYSYVISGATERSGTTNNASGAFNVGTSTIDWTATDDFGNTATCQTTVVINGNPIVSIPDVQALPSGVLVNTAYIGYSPAGSVTLKPVVTGGTPVYNFNWSNGTTADSARVTPATSTNYTVIVTDVNGCADTATKSIAVIDLRAGKKLDKIAICHSSYSLQIDVTSVSEHLAHGDMLGNCGTINPAITKRAAIAEEVNVSRLSVVAYPNPSVNYFLINAKVSASAKFSIKVYDQLGRVVERKENLYGNQMIRVGNGFGRGVYFAEITKGTEKVVLKLVKQ